VRCASVATCCAHVATCCTRAARADDVWRVMHKAVECDERNCEGVIRVTVAPRDIAACSTHDAASRRGTHSLRHGWDGADAASSGLMRHTARLRGALCSRSPPGAWPCGHGSQAV
jgi:hypothetical protein